MTFKTTKDSCPLCGNKIYWTCRGKFGHAYCSKSLLASRSINDRTFCKWKGRVVRESNNVFFIIEMKDIE